MKSPLGIIAGGGRLPLQLVESCQSAGRPYFILAVEDAADIEAISHLPHAVVRLGAVGEAIEQLRRADVREIVLAGHIKRPSFFSLRPDMVGAKLMARMGGALFSGDDAMLSALISFMEEEGFTVVGADTVLSSLLAPEGALGCMHPAPRALEDIARGWKVAKALGALDVGQAVVVENGYVLGVEAAEGTDALIVRCGNLRRESGSGVLVKVKKPTQDTRADLPSIGVQTVEAAHAAGLAGIAVEAGGALILDKEKTIARADALGLFLIGVKYE